MVPANDTRPKAPPIVERFVRQLVVVNKAVALYPPSSAIPRDTARDCAAVLREALKEQPELRLIVGKSGLTYEGAPVFPDQPSFAAFAYELYLRKLADVRFHVGAEPRDIIAFLTILKYTPEEVDAAGGFEARLWEQGVATITVTEVQVTLVEAQVGESFGDADAPLSRDRASIDEALAGAWAGRERDKLTIARIIGNSGAIRDYLQQTYESELGMLGIAGVSNRFTELAQLAVEIGGEEKHELLKSLADAVWQLDADLRRELLFDAVLPEARTSDSLAAVVRQMDVEEICRMLVAGYASGEQTREGLVRAIRNLALISAADREDIVNIAATEMLGAGFSDERVAAIIDQAVPQRITVRAAPSARPRTRPSEAIFQLLDYAPVMAVDEYEDAAILAVQEEAHRGITDGDVITALVSLVGMDTRPAQFGSTMAMLEDALSLLIERGEIETAADAAASLGVAAESADLLPEQRVRLTRAIDRFARPSDVRALARAIRLYKPGTPDYDAAVRLIETLGTAAVNPLLEYLAEESDMAVRKSLVDLLSTMAINYVGELGSHVTDPRWYFVRNVVSILGSTHSSSVLIYLERTLRYPDPRVRRETIRSLAGINDRLALEMIIAALQDEDAQNVQLAARYLGQLGVRPAVPTLEWVARGEGRGNRDMGPRVEAIEALGRLGATEALPTLEALAGKRSIIGASKTRELRAAAESAIAAIKLRGGAR